MTVPFAKGNQFWKARSSHGVKKIYDDPEDLRRAVEEYFEQAAQDSLIETKPHAYEGEITYSEVNKMVPFTEGRLCLFLGISDETWRRYKKDSALKETCAWACSVIYEQKFAGAAAGFFNANIIARDLGLADTNKVEISTGDGLADELARAKARGQVDADG